MELELLRTEWSPKTKKQNNQTYIWDPIRQKWILLSPEEWVRNLLIHYLVFVKKMGKSYLSVEKEIRIGLSRKRFDLVIYDGDLKPWMAIECKAPDINLSEKTISQVVRYNQALECTYVAITNGHEIHIFKEQHSHHWISIESWPSWPAKL
jgi:hypothetical protein